MPRKQKHVIESLRVLREDAHADEASPWVIAGLRKGSAPDDALPLHCSGPV